MRTSLRPLLAAFCAVLLASCSSSGGAAATVDDESISWDELEAAMSAGPAGAPEGTEESPQSVADRQRSVLTILIQDEILQDMGEALGIEVDEEDLDAARERVLESIGGEEALENALSASGLSQEAFEDVIVPQEALIDELRLTVAEGETLETRTVRHILVETEEEAEDVIAELEAGTEFGELAEERSTDPGSASEGGELGAQARGSFVAPFEEAVWGSELDTIVGPVETQFGFHVIEATDESTLTTEEMDDTQLDQVANAQLAELLQAEWEESEISVDAGIGEWDPATRAVVAPDQVGDPETQTPTPPGTGSPSPETEEPAADGGAGTGTDVPADAGTPPAGETGEETDAGNGEQTDGTVNEPSPAS